MKSITLSQLAKYEKKAFTRKSAVDIESTVSVMKDGLAVFNVTSTDDSRKETLSRQTLYKVMRKLIAFGKVFYAWRLDSKDLDVLILSYATFEEAKTYEHKP